MVFNNIINGRTLDQAYRTCSFYDPYIGEDAGYVQVVRLSGVGPVLLAVPDGHTPFEEWKPILDRRDRETGKGLLGNDPTPRGTTFEGSYDWMVHLAAFAESEWEGRERVESRHFRDAGGRQERDVWAPLSGCSGCAAH